MEKINYNGKEFLFVIEQFDCGEYGIWNCYRTHFFDPKPEIVERKKWYFFGPKIKVENFTKLFTLDYSIKSPKILKEKITEDLEKQVKLLNRKEEIERGEII